MTNINSSDFSVITKPVKIEDYVWISTGVTILQGVTIGKGAIIMAGSVVMKNVRPYAIIGGNPGKEIGMRNKNLNYNLKDERNFHTETLITHKSQNLVSIIHKKYLAE